MESEKYMSFLASTDWKRGLCISSPLYHSIQQEVNYTCTPCLVMLLGHLACLIYSGFLRISLVILKLHFCTRAVICPLGEYFGAVEVFCFVEQNFNIVYHALNLTAGR